MFVKWRVSYQSTEGIQPQRKLIKPLNVAGAVLLHRHVLQH